MTSLGLIWSLLSCPAAGIAGVVGADRISVSTIGGTAAGISISSSVWIAPGSSLTLTGPLGTLTGASSVTASAFFGDGRNLGGIASLYAEQSFSDGSLFLSSFSVQSGGKQIVLSTSSLSSNFSLSGGGVFSFSPELHNSSSTFVPAASTSNDNFGPCVDGSTLTIVTAGGRVELIFSGKLSNDERGDGGAFLGNAAELGFLQDGSFVDDFSSSKGIVRATGAGALEATDIGSFRYLLKAPSVGAHAYCLTIARSQVVPGVQSGGTKLGGETNSRNSFVVKEIK